MWKDISFRLFDILSRMEDLHSQMKHYSVSQYISLAISDYLFWLIRSGPQGRNLEHFLHSAASTGQFLRGREDIWSGIIFSKHCNLRWYSTPCLRPSLCYDRRYQGMTILPISGNWNSLIKGLWIGRYKLRMKIFGTVLHSFISNKISKAAFWCLVWWLEGKWNFNWSIGWGKIWKANYF